MNRKQDIILKAARLFRKKGFSSSSMRDIASNVGIEAPSLYNHIKSKHEILEILLLEIAEDFTKGMNSICESDKKASHLLKEIIDLHITLTIEKTDQIALLTHEWINLTGDAKEEFIKHRNEYEVNFRKVIEKGIQNGEFKNLHIDLTVFSTLSTLRWLYAWYKSNPEMDILRLRKDMYTLLVDGLML